MSQIEFRRRAAARADCSVLFPGAFNPPTLAHVELARAALIWAPEVVWVVPAVFPHKGWEGPGLEERIELLLELTSGEPRFSVAVSERGLFIEVARAARAADPALKRLLVLCGRDAAERIVGWDYGDPQAIVGQLEEYELLVAPRGGVYEPPPRLAAKIHALPASLGLDEVSSSEVRARIASGQRWEELVPPEIVARVRELYSTVP